MEEVNVWQVVSWLITGLIGLVLFFERLHRKETADTIKAHGQTLSQHQMELQELKSIVAINTKSDELRMESLQKSSDTILDAIKDIKISQGTSQQEVKQIDKRLTDFIIDTLRK
jgi:hypothetical protein